jgi:hypothetical protein
MKKRAADFINRMAEIQAAEVCPIRPKFKIDGAWPVKLIKRARRLA